MSRCLVIGGGGFIGGHLVPRLVAAGRAVTVMGRSVVPRVALPERVNYCAGGFEDGDLMRDLIGANDDVIHLAYATVPNTSFDNPLGDLLENLPAAVRLFSEVAAQGKRLLLMSSGGTVYGEGTRLPIAESHPTLPISPYGVTKLTLERYAFLYSITHDLNVICLRPSNAFGEGQRPFAGQGFVANAMAASMRGDSVKIFGPQGTIRDYIHVGDLADAIVRVLEHGERGETYNIGSGIGRSNLEVVDAMRPLLAEMDCELRIEHAPARVFDVRANVLDSTKLARRTGWQPRVTFEEGLLRSRDWLKGNPG